MIFPVSPISQYGLTEDPSWDERACGIASLLMVIKFLNPKLDITGDELLKKCISLNGYIPGVGWKHRELAQAAESYGFFGDSYDWYQKPPQDAFECMKEKLKEGPVIASVCNGFVPGNGGHLVVVKGIDYDVVHINEPAEKKPEKIVKEIPLDTFLNGWKRRVIIIREK